MNFKLAFFLLFIGASSAAFIGNTNSQVAAKKNFESVSNIFGSRLQKTAAVAPKQDDILTEITNLLVQIAIEWIATGTISQASQDALVDLLLHAEIIEVLQILESLVDILPQELVDFLVDLGILPPQAKTMQVLKGMLAKQDDILDQLTNLLIQIAIEFIATGSVSDASLAALTELLTQIDVVELLNLLDSLIGFLIPQELIDFLVDLGILPPAAKDLAAMKRTVAKQDDILGQIQNLLIQIAIEFIATGTVSDASLAALTELLTQIDLVELLGLLDSLIGFLIPQELIDFLVDLGILPPAAAALPTMKRMLAKQDDILDQITNLLIQIAIEFIATGTVSDASLAAITELLTQIDVVELLNLLDSLIGFLIPQELIDFLVDLGILPPAAMELASMKRTIAKQDDILDQLTNLLIQIAIEFIATGTVSDASLAALTELLTQIDVVELLNLLDSLIGFLIPQELIDFLIDLGILPPAVKALSNKQDNIIDQVTNLLIQIAIEFIATGTVSDASLAALTELLTQIDLVELLGLLDSLIGFLIPQELIDFLVDLGILPPAAAALPTMKRMLAKQDDILDQLTNLLIQIAIEFIATGTVGDANLAALTELLTQIDVVELLNLLESLIGFLIPQELIDFLVDLGILPPPATELASMKRSVAAKQDDILDQLTNLLIQIAIEFIATGSVSDASLAALTELLTQIDVVELLNLLDSLIGFLIPQELIDFLVDLGILPPAAIKALSSTKQDILGEFLALLFQIVDELAQTGEVSQASLDLLTQLLTDIESVIGADWLAELITFIEPFLSFLPQEIIDILAELGLLPPPENRLKATVKMLSATVGKKDIWQDLVDTLIAQLVQILADLDNLGITVSDEVLAQIETLILAIMAEGGVAWETLQAWLEQYAIELQEILGELLGEIGIIP